MTRANSESIQWTEDKESESQPTSLLQPNIEWSSSPPPTKMNTSYSTPIEWETSPTKPSTEASGWIKTVPIREAKEVSNVKQPKKKSSSVNFILDHCDTDKEANSSNSLLFNRASIDHKEKVPSKGPDEKLFLSKLQEANARLEKMKLGTLPRDEFEVTPLSKTEALNSTHLSKTTDKSKNDEKKQKDENKKTKKDTKTTAATDKSLQYGKMTPKLEKATQSPQGDTQDKTTQIVEHNRPNNGKNSQNIDSDPSANKIGPVSSAVNVGSASLKPPPTNINSPKPKPKHEHEIRTWTDVSGSFQVTASFISLTSVEPFLVYLLRNDLVKVSVPLVKLSREDVLWIKDKSGIKQPEDIIRSATAESNSSTNKKSSDKREIAEKKKANINHRAPPPPPPPSSEPSKRSPSLHSSSPANQLTSDPPQSPSTSVPYQTTPAPYKINSSFTTKPENTEGAETALSKILKKQKEQLQKKSEKLLKEENTKKNTELEAEDKFAALNKPLNKKEIDLNQIKFDEKPWKKESTPIDEPKKNLSTTNENPVEHLDDKIDSPDENCTIASIKEKIEKSRNLRKSQSNSSDLKIQSDLSLSTKVPSTKRSDPLDRVLKDIKNASSEELSDASPSPHPQVAPSQHGTFTQHSYNNGKHQSYTPHPQMPPPLQPEHKREGLARSMPQIVPYPPQLPHPYQMTMPNHFSPMNSYHQPYVPPPYMQQNSYAYQNPFVVAQPPNYPPPPTNSYSATSGYPGMSGMRPSSYYVETVTSYTGSAPPPNQHIYNPNPGYPLPPPGSNYRAPGNFNNYPSQ